MTATLRRSVCAIGAMLGVGTSSRMSVCLTAITFACGAKAAMRWAVSLLGAMT